MTEEQLRRFKDEQGELHTALECARARIFAEDFPVAQQHFADAKTSMARLEKMMEDEAHEQDLQFAREKLPLAQQIAPETTGIMIDSEHGWFGHSDGVPTTHIAEPNEIPERLK